MLQTPSAVVPQETASPSAEQRDVSLDRIRSRLAEPPFIAMPSRTPVFTTERRDKPLFQVRVEGPPMPPWDWLDTGTSIPGYIRPTFPLPQHEFLMAVTPEVFRASVVHPVGVPVLSIARATAKATHGPLRRRREAQARQEVAEALAAFVASTRTPPDTSAAK